MGENPKWAEITAIATGLDENRLGASAALVGKTFALAGKDSERRTLQFEQDAVLADGSRQVCDVVECAEDLYVLGYQHTDNRLALSVWVLDTRTGAATLASITLPTVEASSTSLIERVHAGGELTPVKVVFSHWSIDGTDAPAHTPTASLVGKRIRYVYGDGGVYEHIYLNESLYTWHCLAGPEAGLADTDACTAYDIRPDAYLFCWREKIIPTVGIVLVVQTDAQYQSTGYLMGIDTHDGSVSFFPAGAKGQLLNHTEYPA